MPIPPEKTKDLARANSQHIRHKPGGGLDFSPEFRDLWARIGQRTRYRVEFNSDELVAGVVAELKNQTVSKPVIRRTLGGFMLSESGEFIARAITGTEAIGDLPNEHPLPDIIQALSSLLTGGRPSLVLTRKTLFAIFEQCYQNAFVNPMEWANIAADVIRQKLADMMIGGIVYEKIDGESYAWEQRFASAEKDIIGKFIAEMPSDNKNAAYDKIDGDSDVEKKFAEALAHRSDVKLFVKLPAWFQVPTPVGNYNPDWAILMNSDKLIFVAETKSAVVNRRIQFDKMRKGEELKIKCAAHYFGSTQEQIKYSQGLLPGADYQVVREAADIASRYGSIEQS